MSLEVSVKTPLCLGDIHHNIDGLNFNIDLLSFLDEQVYNVLTRLVSTECISKDIAVIKKMIKSHGTEQTRDTSPMHNFDVHISQDFPSP